MERHQVQKGFLDTALRVTAISAMIIVTLCVAAFGLSKLRSPESRIASTDPNSALHGDPTSTASSSSPGSASRSSRPAGPDPLEEHLERLGKRLDELTSTVTRERSTQTEIARLADSMQAVQHQTDLSDTRLQTEIGNLRVSSEVELRDLNRQVNGVSQNSQRLEREMLEQRAGILSALESQKKTITSQVASLKGGLDDVHSELSELRSKSQSALAAVNAARLQPPAALNPLLPGPGSHAAGHSPSPEHDSTWQEPRVLDSSASIKRPTPRQQRAVETATSTGWKVSPMSHSIPQTKPAIESAIPKLTLPQAPPAEPEPAILPPLPEFSRRAGMIRAPLKSTLAPSRATRLNRVPEIVELPIPEESRVRQIAAVAPAIEEITTRTYEVQTTVIHLAASRPVDVEPAGVRMLNPELSTTAYGQPWSHDAVTHELLRKISLRTEATIAGRQQTSITSAGTERLSIGSSCPHCNEVHGFEAGDRLILSAGPAEDKVQRFHIVSEVAGGGNELDSMPQFDLTPMANQTYVICEEAVEGTVEESIELGDEKLVPIHGVLTPVSGPSETRVSTQLMQRVVVMTFRDVNARSADRVVTSATRPTTGNTTKQLAPIVLPAPEQKKQTVVKKLTRVKQHPVFLPPPAPSNLSVLTASNAEFVAPLPRDSSSRIQRAKHEQDGDYCEVCEQTHGPSVPQTANVADPAPKKEDRSFLDWFRRVRSESPDSEPGNITNADFQVNESKGETKKPQSTVRKSQRRYVTKPGNRRSVR